MRTNDRQEAGRGESQALHPFIKAMLAKFAAEGRPAISAGSPEDARALLAAGRAGLGPGPEIGSIEDLTIPSRGGDLAARLLRPPGAPAGLIVYLHGGGWALGTLDDFEPLARFIAAESGCAVLLPDYRLAPEHPFPAGLEDCEDTLLFADARRAEICGAQAPLIVAGDSAGANLGTVAARRLKGRVNLALQALIYPVTDCDFDRPSYRECSDGMPLTRADMIWFFTHYAPPSEWTNPDISPLRAADLAGSPPSVIVTAAFDVLRDEGEAYAKKLEEAGVPVTLTRVEGLTHGFARLHNHVDLARRAISDLARGMVRR